MPEGIHHVHEIHRLLQIAFWTPGQVAHHPTVARGSLTVQSACRFHKATKLLSRHNAWHHRMNTFTAPNSGCQQSALNLRPYRDYHGLEVA